MPKLQIIQSGLFDAKTNAIRMPSIPCSFVLLCNWTSANDQINAPGNAPEPETPSEEIYWGADGVCVNQLFTGTTTILIPVANLNQIYVRCSQDNLGKRLYYTCFDEI